MGFLSSLFGKKKTQAPSVPTVGLRKEKIDSFNQSLYKHLSPMECFSDNDIQEISRFISNVPNGFINKGAWHYQIYEMFFKSRDWSLPDFEEHNESTIPEWDPFQKLCKKLKVNEKKEILSRLGIEFDKKAKNNELFDLLIEKTTKELLTSVMPELSAVFDEEKEKNRKRIYSDFMQHIHGYANNLDTVIKAKELGVRHKFVFFDRDAENKAKHIIMNNPDALPPFFPGDRTMVKLDLPS